MFQQKNYNICTHDQILVLFLVYKVLSSTCEPQINYHNKICINNLHVCCYIDQSKEFTRTPTDVIKESNCKSGKPIRLKLPSSLRHLNLLKTQMQTFSQLAALQTQEIKYIIAPTINLCFSFISTEMPLKSPDCSHHKEITQEEVQVQHPFLK